MLMSEQTLLSQRFNGGLYVRMYRRLVEGDEFSFRWAFGFGIVLDSNFVQRCDGLCNKLD
jgi:hypothetical protein